MVKQMWWMQIYRAAVKPKYCKNGRGDRKGGGGYEGGEGPKAALASFLKGMWQRKYISLQVFASPVIYSSFATSLTALYSTNGIIFRDRGPIVMIHHSKLIYILYRRKDKCRRSSLILFQWLVFIDQYILTVILKGDVIPLWGFDTYCSSRIRQQMEAPPQISSWAKPNFV